MTALAIHRPPPPEVQAITLPEPRVAISIRVAEQRDLRFIDDLQRKHAKMVGWFPTRQLETNIKGGKILIAESGNESVGYVIAHDKYLKREELGICYQLNVLPGKQRGLIGATLIKAVFDRAAYGCKLFCCWCAQDLEANHFWESIGFVPLAFRTGSRPRMTKSGKITKPGRTHIFWQRHIREGDTETPYWFPSETTGGAVRENRLVLPIPPGTHWSDAKPAVLPEFDEAMKALPLPLPLPLPGAGAEVEKKPRKPKTAPVAVRPASRGVWVAPPPPTKEQIAAAKKAEKVKQPRQKFKNDPKMVAAARELRDRYIEQINQGLLLPPSACGKYDVSRQLEAAPTAMELKQVPPPPPPPEVKLLNAA
jgi:hypothetical protein